MRGQCTKSCSKECCVCAWNRYGERIRAVPNSCDQDLVSGSVSRPVQHTPADSTFLSDASLDHQGDIFSQSNVGISALISDVRGVSISDTLLLTRFSLITSELCTSSRVRHRISYVCFVIECFPYCNTTVATHRGDRAQSIIGIRNTLACLRDLEVRLYLKCAF